MSVVMLAGDGDSTWMIANALKDAVPLRAVVVEESIGSWARTRSRARRQGWATAIGQVLFVLYSRALHARSRARIRQIAAEHGLCAERPTGVQLLAVKSANDAEAITLLQRLAPRVVVVNGTRILSTKLLTSVDAVFLNMHAGITPMYRGVHGGYWALAEDDAENAGVTVHLVDAGIDTGGVLYQARIQPELADNFCTYPLLQLAAGVPLLLQAVREALAGRLQTRDPQMPSKLHYHPTLWRYLWLRLARGVR